MFLDLSELNLLQEAPEDDIEVEEDDTSLDNKGDSTEDASTEKSDIEEDTSLDDEESEEETSTEETEEDETSIDSGEEFANQSVENDEALDNPGDVDITGFKVDEIKLAELYEKFITTKNILEQLKDTLADLNYHKNSKLIDTIQNSLDKLVNANTRILLSDFVVENYESYLSSYYFIHGNLQTLNDIFTAITDGEKSKSDK